ncbi:MAG: tetratricopeptide repeat protein [Pyrinomonadaceae bacterium]
MSAGAFLILVAIVFFQPLSGLGQAGAVSHVLLGDVKVDESQMGRPAGLLSFHIILYTTSGRMVDRQVVVNNGRFRFFGVRNGEYDLVIEHETAEIGRIRVMVQSTYRTDFRQDIALELKPGFSTRSRPRPGTISVEDTHERGAATKSVFSEASQELTKKNYARAIALLRQIVSVDPGDFQAWTEMGTAYLMQKDYAEAEKAYAKAVETRPTFFLALLNLGRLHLLQKNFEGAVAVLTKAVEVKSASAEANYYLGEAYLQVKKGSKAVGYLNEALKLDPIGKADAHLRLAALYNAAGIKDQAAVEYQEFLKKKPDYPDKKKLEQYIAQNKKR